MKKEVENQEGGESAVPIQEPASPETNQRASDSLVRAYKTWGRA